MSEKILVIEDSPEFQKLISRTLFGYDVVISNSAEDATLQVYKENFDLILLDITLPKRDGYAFLSELQSDDRTRDIPVFCITGKGATSDKTAAFSLGADDYIVKPFDPIELKARIESKLEKLRSLSKSSVINVGDIRIDLNVHKAFLLDKGIATPLLLTQTEFNLLTFFCVHADQALTREQLLMNVWGESSGALERAVDVQIHGLRKKLMGCSSYLKSIPGVGYIFHPTV